MAVKSFITLALLTCDSDTMSVISGCESHRDNHRALSPPCWTLRSPSVWPRRALRRPALPDAARDPWPEFARDFGRWRKIWTCSTQVLGPQQGVNVT